MLTPSKKLQLSGGHIVVDSSVTACYNSGNNSASLPWDNVDDINTPDIDVDFFMNESPFARKPMLNDNTPLKEEFNVFNDPLPSLVNTVAVVPEVDTHSRGSLFETENSFADLSQLINESAASNTSLMVGPNDVLHINTSIADCTPTLDTPSIISTFATLTPLSNVTSMKSVDMNSHPLVMQSLASLQPQIQSQFQTHLEPNPRPQSTSSSYAMPLSPAESFISSNSAQNSYISPSPQSDVTMDYKEDLFHPTVIDDHLYTVPSAHSSSDNSTKYSSLRKKNNAASKRSRLTKRDKQKQMDEKIAFFLEDNAKAKREIETLERQIEWCKSYLFNRVLQASKK